MKTSKSYKSRKSGKKIVLQEDNHAVAPYKLVSLKNTIEWSIGQRFTHDDVQEIMNRLGPWDVEIVIK